MSVIRSIIPAVALAAGAYAANSCSASGTLTVTNTADAASISACSTYTGSIAVATDATTFELDGPKRITGSLLVVPGGQLQSLGAANLQIIDQTLNITGLTQIASINMPALTEVTTFFLQNTGTYLSALNFGSGTAASPGLKQVTDLTVDDTYLNNLNGINLTTAGTVTVTNNQQISSLTMSLVNTTGDIQIRGNSGGLAVNLNNLVTTDNLYILDCSSVQLNSLQNTSGTVSLNENSATTLYLPNLTSTGTGFTVQENPQLTNLSVPLLKNVQSLSVNFNGDLSGNITFPSLTNVAGAINMTGVFSGVSFPELNRVLGVTYINSTADISSTCTTLSDESSVFAKTPICAGSQPSGTGTTGGSGTGSPSTSSGAAVLYGADSQRVYGVFGALAALMGFLM